MEMLRPTVPSHRTNLGSPRFHRIGFLAILAGCISVSISGLGSSAVAAPFPHCLLLFQPPTGVVRSAQVEIRKAAALITQRKSSVTHADIPGVNRLSICPVPPKAIPDGGLPVSAGVADPLLERARELDVYEDFKIISDYRFKDLSALEVDRLHKRAVAVARRGNAKDFEKIFLKNFIDTAYEKPLELISAKKYVPPKWKMQSGDPRIDAAFDYTENTWGKLLQETRPKAGGSLLPSPYPVLVPAGRFQEAYYWDTYFGMKGLFATGRLDVAQMQVENLLEYVRRFGFVPNGGRDYYLTRSQPPFLSSMVREVFEATLKKAKSPAEAAQIKRWLKERAYPLIKRDYDQFWMNPKTRYDAETGLNHHWDDLDIARMERHGADNELALGKTYRDTRAGAESGLDFTDAFEAEPTKVAGPLLNSMLFKTESDLAWMSALVDAPPGETARFKSAANRRRAAIDRHLWNGDRRRYEPYHLGKRRTVNVLSADAFTPLFVGAASETQAAGMQATLSVLEKEGGIMASDLMGSVHQWDGSNGWAPYQVMAIEGLRRYGYAEDGKRIAGKWVAAVTKTFSDGGAMFERVDVVKMSKPVVDEHKYPTQEGFLWTNGSFVWAAKEILGMPLVRR